MNILVMDVEGTDGHEHGEDKVCLPSASSACLLTMF
jgi:Root hair defective 3 GTP-binding protein (RHD3)